MLYCSDDGDDDDDDSGDSDDDDSDNVDSDDDSDNDDSNNAMLLTRPGSSHYVEAVIEHTACMAFHRIDESAIC